MSSNVHIVNNVNASNSINSQPKLHDGSVVKGTVISGNGGSSYTISIAGQKINVQSRIPLQQGAVFTARLGVEGDVLVIKLLDEVEQSSGFTKLSLDALSSENKSLGNFLNSLGLPVTAESLKLVQFALELGIKPQGIKLNKALSRSKNNDGKVDEEKSQALLLLDDKKITLTERAVEKVLGNGTEHSNDFGEGEINQKKNDEQAVTDGQISSVDVKNYFDLLDEAAENQDAGELTLFNSLKGRESDGHWFVLPFNWSYRNSFGLIRVLFDKSEKSLKKIVLNCQNSRFQTKFVLNFKSKEINSIKFGFDGIASDISKEKLKSEFQKFFSLAGFKVDEKKIEAVSLDEIKGFAPEYESISVVDLKA